MENGTVKWFNPRRGYGFLTGADYQLSREMLLDGIKSCRYRNVL